MITKDRVDIKNKKNPIIAEVMERVGNWLSIEARSISDSSQLIAYHLACLTEDRYRKVALSGSDIGKNDVAVHDKYRDWLFSLEWSLRFISKLPQNSITKQSHIRQRWSQAVSDRCFRLLDQMEKYKGLRDLMISANRGGYYISRPTPNIIIFKDVPDWSGIHDYKNRYIMQLIENEQNIMLENKYSIEEPSRKLEYSYKEFPQNIETSSFLSSEFWMVYDYLFKICVNEILIRCKKRKRGKDFVTSPIRELTLMIAKNTLCKNISVTTGLSMQKIESILKWISFNSETDKKLTLFHCPVIELNKSICLITPHSIPLGHPPTLFLRLLAHNDKKIYDSISKQLEEQKLNEIALHLNSKKTIEKINCKIEYENIKNEIDLVQYNKAENKLNIVQTKMIIRPDNVAEVDNANETISKGVAQLQSNKYLLESAGVRILLNKFGISVVSDPEINYFLMPIGFCGSDFLNKPDWAKIMLLDYCLLPRHKSKTLNQIWDEYQSLWNSFNEKATASKTTEEFELAGFKITYPGFLI